jgi:signal transduction histidine kinase
VRGMPPEKFAQYVAPMRRLPPAPASLLDVGVAVLLVAMTAVACWVSPNPIGTPVAGPAWLLAVFPVLFAAPLAWRRSAPLVALAVPLATLAGQSLLTGNSPEGLEVICVVGLAVYSVAAHAARRTAVVGLLAALAVYAVYAVTNHDIRTLRAGELWAGSFFLLALIAAWLTGIFVRIRREERRRRDDAVDLERRTEHAAAEERARLARELHDVISHTLSVVVLQAAGARAAGNAAPATLEKIENSGRQSLTEMRRLLDVLRHDGADSALTPQPGAADLPALAAQLTDAGLPVRLTVDGDLRDLPPALGLSVYRIVQESLTNVLKHAGVADAEVTVRADGDAVVIDVVDNGAGTTGPREGGHGLVGMRERAALFKGELTAGPGPAGGFAVHARLLRDGRSA